MDRSTDVLKSPWTQRPRKISLDRGLLWLSTNWMEMKGFPPVPPRTGCLGIVTVCPAGMTVAVAVDSTVKVWVPVRLFSNSSWTATPPCLIAPCRVICGLGELSQPEVVIEVWTCTGVWKVALAVVVAWATPATPRTASTSATIAVFFIMFFETGLWRGFVYHSMILNGVVGLREITKDSGSLRLRHLGLGLLRGRWPEALMARLLDPKSFESSRLVSQVFAYPRL